MTTILFATTNKHKEKIFRRSWDNAGLDNTFKYCTLDEVEIDIDIDEDTGTFKGDALKKAVAYGNATGMITISQDRGFVFDALNWPGTLTKEVTIGNNHITIGEDGFPVTKSSDDKVDHMQKAREVLSAIGDNDRSMTVINATALYIPGTAQIVEEIHTPGIAAEEPVEGLEGSFSRYFIARGHDRPLASQFNTIDELIDYWARVICVLPHQIVDALNSM